MYESNLGKQDVLLSENCVYRRGSQKDTWCAFFSNYPRWKPDPLSIQPFIHSFIYSYIQSRSVSKSVTSQSVSQSVSHLSIHTFIRSFLHPFIRPVSQSASQSVIYEWKAIQCNARAFDLYSILFAVVV